MLWRLIARLSRRVAAWRDPLPTNEDSGTAVGAAPPARVTSASELAALLYPDLKKIARARMRRERSDHTLQPTALVNELYLQLLQRPDPSWTSREHFLVSASRAMQHLLIDHARARAAEKRGGGWVRVELDDPGGDSAGLGMIELAELLARLETKEPRMADVVRLKFFGGLSVVEIAKVLNIDERTAKRDWALARQWLRGHLENR